jgi:hypothetical protein
MQDRQGNTPLHEAVLVQNQDMVKIIKSTNLADVTIKNKDGFTAGILEDFFNQKNKSQEPKKELNEIEQMEA